MGRMDHIVGLNSWARLVASQAVKKFRWSEFHGMFDFAYPLWAYQMEDGSILREYVQSDRWSGGPNFYLALMDAKEVPMVNSLWRDDQHEGVTQ